jgi:hypothetical protein
MTNSVARLIVPALRWDRAHGFRYLEGLIEDALGLGVGGFFIESGPRDDVAALVGRLHAESQHPLLIAMRAERGAGDSIEGLTHLPPFAALSSVALVEHNGVPSLDPEPIRRAARITARELRNLGANWALAPNCNPGTAIGNASADPAVVSAIVGEWVDTCQAESVIATAMSFRGKASAPISAAIDAGASCVMVASATGIEGTLRASMEFDGLVSSRSFDHDPSITPQNEQSIAVESITAGCDLILAPGDLNGVSGALERALSSRALSEQRVRAASERIARWAGWGTPGEAREVSLDDVMWSRQVADAAARWVRGARPRIGASVEVISVDGSSFEHFIAVLRSQHITVRESIAPSPDERGPLVIIWHAATPPSREEFDRVQGFVAVSLAARRDTVIVHPQHPDTIPALALHSSALAVWDASRPMQEAAARAVVTVG